MIQFIDTMLNDPYCSIIDILDISNDSNSIKAVTIILDKCIKIKSNIYSFDET